VLVCSSSLLIRRHQRARCQAETPLIDLFRFAEPALSLLDIETAIRAAASQTYLVANSTTAGFQIVFGTPSWQAALADAGLTVEQNWAALARRK
jgi:hypothetical protein